MPSEQQVRLDAVLAARERQLSAALAECCNLTGEIAVLQARLAAAHKRIEALSALALERAERTFEAHEEERDGQDDQHDDQGQPPPAAPEA